MTMHLAKVKRIDQIPGGPDGFQATAEVALSGRFFLLNSNAGSGLLIIRSMHKYSMLKNESTPTQQFFECAQKSDEESKCSKW